MNGPGHLMAAVCASYYATVASTHKHKHNSLHYMATLFASALAENEFLGNS